jgi:molybdopterin molybdotransferase
VISVAEAEERILAGLSPVGAEEVSLTDALGRTLAKDVRARLTQPPWPVSAMDGYAVRAADVRIVPVDLEIVAEVPAGQAHAGTVGAGQCARIFTGAPLPSGTDAIVIQEDAERRGHRVTIKESAPKDRYVRPAGLDFAQGDVGIAAGRRLGARDIGLAAAMNVPWLRVRRRPRVAILATGDEIVRPGDPVGPHQIVSSNGFALAACVTAFGGVPVPLGIAKDTVEDTLSHAEAAHGADLLVTTGGASVGDHDLVQKALGTRGLRVDFWKIAMRPGKPLMWGDFAGIPVLGLPGNPVSTLVCALIFLRPAINALLGRPRASVPTLRGLLTTDLSANDQRQDYLRSDVKRGLDGSLLVTPFAKQDSSMLKLLASSSGLAVRPPRDPPRKAGDGIDVIVLDEGLL